MRSIKHSIANAGPSVQSVIAGEYNSRAYAHRNRLGGVSYFTDFDAKLVTYNEFDASAL